MRVITGIARGRALKAPKGMNTRPTTDRVKEALFNIISPKVQESGFLDLFAGTGGIGIEALSRGAAMAVFVEQDPKALKVIEENLALTGLGQAAKVYRGDVLRTLSVLGHEKMVFDIIFMDPPYLQGFEEPVLLRILEYGLLKKDGQVIVESSKRDSLPTGVKGALSAVRTEKYGDTNITFYSLNKEGIG